MQLERRLDVLQNRYEFEKILVRLIESMMVFRRDKEISGKFSDYLVSCEAVPSMRQIIWKWAWDFLVEALTPSLIIFLTHHPFLYMSTERNEVVILFSASEYKNAKLQLHKVVKRQ